MEQGNSGTEIAEQSNQENNDIAVQDGSISTQAVDTSNWDLTKVNIVYDTANVAVPVPKGYVASGADGEHSVNTGFVIYEGDTAVTTDNAWNESCIRNQWVWVPVPDVSRIYEVDENGKKKSKLYDYSSTGRTMYSNNNCEPGILANTLYSAIDKEYAFAVGNLQGMTKEKFLHEMQEEFDFTIESIKKYGGFYIGRYETGSLSSKTLVVQRMNTDIVGSTWYTEYSRLQRLGVNGNVKSNMIWGCLWDETLQWLVDSGNKTYSILVSSTAWGNYYNTGFNYKKSISGSTSTKLAYTSSVIPSGSTERSNANNIYDLAGNVWEFTLEGDYSRYRSYRGGSYSDTGSGNPVSSLERGYPNISYEGVGFRTYLYIR